MHGYLFDTEYVRFAFILGVILSIFVYDRWHITTGSLVVPGYVAVFILQPVTLVMTLVNALLTYFIVYRVLTRYTLIYGRSKFFALIPFSVGLQILFLETSGEGPFLGDRQPFLVGIGFVIPALIAHDVGRQGVRNTVVAIMGVGAVVAAPLLALSLWIPDIRLSDVSLIHASLAFEITWLPYAIVFSALASSALVQTYGFKAGGFISAAYLSLIAASAGQIAFIVALTLLTYVIVTRLLMRHLILFGRRKFAAMLVVGSLLSWLALLVGERVMGIDDLPFSSLPLAGIVLAGLLANDIERVGLVRVVQGTTLAVLFTLHATLLLQELTGDRRADVIEPVALLALTTGVLIFGRYIQAVWAAITTSSGEPRFALLWAGLNQRRGTERIVLPSELPGATNVVRIPAGAFDDPLDPD